MARTPVAVGPSPRPSVRPAGKPKRILLFDGYIDEPANFGVPPYIPPHARYLAGAAKAAHPDHEVRYVTVDEWRRDTRQADWADAGGGERDSGVRAAGAGARALVGHADLLVVIAGALVPGKYLRGTPLSFRECERLLETFGGTRMIAGSSALYGFGAGGGKPPEGREKLDTLFHMRARLHADALLHDWLLGHSDGRTHQRKRTLEEWRDWSVAGAFIVRDHPDHPQPLTAEVDTYHGCVRYVNGGCSFCMEPKEGKPTFRPVEDVVAEVAALAAHGVVNFRVGGQACFYSYHAKGLGETPTPEPDPESIEALLLGIRKACPDLHCLHLDNVDPAVVAANPEASLAVTKLVCAHMTDGNVAAFGLESADPAVQAANNLNADGAIVMEAAAILQAYGAERGPTGFPRFLPGLNFLAGLPGESAETYAHNVRFLEEYVARGLLARRINIRKVAVGGVEVNVDQRRFLEFKRFVRHEIDRPMMRRILPAGTVIRDVFMEAREGIVSFGRPIGSYAMLVGVPYEVPLDGFVDVAVTDHGFRSLTGVVVPFPVNRARLKQLEALPGVGKKRAVRLSLKRPFRGPEDVARALDDPAVAEGVVPLLGYE